MSIPEHQLAIVHEAVDEIARDIAPIVREIEAGPEVTQGHYARYLAILSRCEGKAQAGIMAMAMIKAGARRQGVGNALRILGYL